MLDQEKGGGNVAKRSGNLLSGLHSVRRKRKRQLLSQNNVLMKSIKRTGKN